MNQKPFGKYIAAIYRNIQTVLNEKLSDLGIGSGQYDFLYAITQNEGLSQKELTEILSVEKATTSKAIKKLIALNYVERRISPDDGRVFNLFLTEKGREITPRITTTFEELIAIYSGGFSDEESEKVTEDLQHILNNVTTYNKREKQ